MSKEKLLSVQPKTPHIRRLQQLLLEYHEYRQQRDHHPLGDFIDYLGDWQVTRLKRTHHDLYTTPQYHDALEFLLKDLYSPKEFARRDADLERIFPVMVKLVPDQALGTVANLIELNLLTQKLDEHMAVVLTEELKVEEITEESYAEAFRRCQNLAAREHQIHLIRSSGEALEKYVRSRFLNFSLAVTQGPAEMAGLGQLHQFLNRGLKAFKSIGGVKQLLTTIISRENEILQRIYTGYEEPFVFQ
ncbi:FFLEELY motif protein [Hahella ganghwensis]|uniref:FFLEELY motif protein n=1 Tax=Hahella ganghwensis TaxID=286420 RepID=UPI0003611CC9|nr:hypothetical protein [Hahella ganghwensis]